MQGIEPLRYLESLNLEDNRISKIESLMYCQRLKKLYLSKNFIRKLEGTQFCASLQELYLSQQRFAEGEYFLIDQESIIGVSETLQTLEMNSVRCRSIENLQFLRNLPFLLRLHKPSLSARELNRQDSGHRSSPTRYVLPSNARLTPESN